MPRTKQTAKLFLKLPSARSSLLHVPWPGENPREYHSCGKPAGGPPQCSFAKETHEQSPRGCQESHAKKPSESWIVKDEFSVCVRPDASDKQQQLRQPHEYDSRDCEIAPPWGRDDFWRYPPPTPNGPNQNCWWSYNEEEPSDEWQRIHEDVPDGAHCFTSEKDLSRRRMASSTSDLVVLSMGARRRTLP